MKAKRFTTLLVTVLMVFGITACNKNESIKNTDLYIEPAVLTQQEENILKLIGSTENSNLIIDFNLDDSVKSMEYSVYRLNDDTWEPKSISRQVLTDSKGRLSLSFERLSEGFRMAIQSENNSGSTKHFTLPEDMTEEQIALSKMGIGSTRLSNKTLVEYEKEIPIVLQVITKNNEIRLTLDGFENPEEYTKMDYEAVYTVTIKFSQNEIENMA